MKWTLRLQFRDCVSQRPVVCLLRQKRETVLPMLGSSSLMGACKCKPCSGALIVDCLGILSASKTHLFDVCWALNGVCTIDFMTRFCWGPNRRPLLQMWLTWWYSVAMVEFWRYIYKKWYISYHIDSNVSVLVMQVHGPVTRNPSV